MSDDQILLDDEKDEKNVRVGQQSQILVFPNEIKVQNNQENYPTYIDEYYIAIYRK